MKESHAFDQLRKPLVKLPDNSPGLISDEKWEKMLHDHDEALAKPLTSQQKIFSFLWGLGFTAIIVGFALIMAMPELQGITEYVIQHLFHMR